MATATVTTPVSETTTESNVLPIKTENVVYGRFVKGKFNDTTQKTDWEVKIVRAYTEEDKKELEAKGYKLQFSQTVTTYRALTVEGFALLIPDADENVAVFNRGYAQKESNKITALFNESKEDGTPEYEPTEGPYDERELLATPTNRRNLSPIDKTIKQIRSSSLPDAIKDSMIAHLQKEIAAASAV